jgi:hypothetical protein
MVAGAKEFATGGGCVWGWPVTGRALGTVHRVAGVLSSDPQKSLDFARALPEHRVSTLS